MTSTKNILRIAIPRPLYTLLDYRCPDALTVQVGCRVRVPLGRSVSMGIVVEITDKSAFKTLRFILNVIDKEPLIEKHVLQLLHWSSRYYHYPVGDVIFNALPPFLRTGKTLPLVKLWQINTAQIDQADELLKRAPKQQQLWDLLYEIAKDTWLDEQHIEHASLAINKRQWKPLLRELKKKNLINEKLITPTFTPSTINPIADKKITLTDEQQETLTQLATSYQEKTIKPTLLHGITGSGKTEIYLRTMKPMLASGQQALILVPEIGLTPQLFKRFQHYFPHHSVARLHSALSDSERTAIWLSIKASRIDIVIGTRSAVFVPLENLGIIIIDEEHDGSFKQQGKFPYQARDLAVKRAYDLNIPIILGSATPALESLQNVERKRYHYLRLNSRPGTRTRPQVLVQDIRSEHLEAGISSALFKEIKQHIDAENQVMLFLNRRGFAPILYCPSCGWNAICQSCETNMTYHAGIKKTICHHCEYTENVDTTCPTCQHTGITTLGQGTERIEHVLQTHFPDTPVIRIDRDTVRRKGALDSKLAIVQQGKPVILIGTQMLTKGHDFPNLTLVGILDIDQSLFSVDYRAQEQLAQQIVQVSGRAGRGERKGRVLLQTSQPQHPLLTSLLNEGYLNVAKQLLSERERWCYPPFGFQVLIRVSATDKGKGFSFLQKLCQNLSTQDLQQLGVTLLGPAPSPMEKRANRYRFQLLINSVNRSTLHKVTSDAIEELKTYKRAGKVRWSVDVDPTNML